MTAFSESASAAMIYAIGDDCVVNGETIKVDFVSPSQMIDVGPSGMDTEEPIAFATSADVTEHSIEPDTELEINGITYTVSAVESDDDGEKILYLGEN